LHLGSKGSSSIIQASQALHIGDDVKRWGTYFYGFVYGSRVLTKGVSDYFGARNAGWHSLLLRRGWLTCFHSWSLLVVVNPLVYR
jgi:hypothetical protein